MNGTGMDHVEATRGARRETYRDALEWSVTEAFGP